MLTANHRKSSPTSELSSDFSDSSPRRNHPLPPPPPRRDSHHRERSPERYHRSSTRNNKSPPARSQNSHRAKSQTKEKPTNHVRSPKREYSRSPRRKKVPLEHMRSRSHRDSRSPVNLKPHTRIRDRRKSSPSPIYLRSPVSNENSRSPSPHTKRLRHANQDKEYAYRPMGRRSRGGHEKERHEQTIDKRISTEKSNGRSSKSTIRDHSNSPYQRNDRRKYSSQSPLKSSKIQRRDERNTANDSEQHMNSEDESIAKMKATEEALEAKKKEKPSFELSGKLAEETNRVRGVTLLFNEPADACKPDIRWRLYVFKGGEALNEPLYVHRQSCYLFGRERRVADIPTDHPSCSKQHAVIQYRSVEKEQPDGMIEKNVRPYLMDLGSTNETSINGNCVEPHRYYELFEKDTIKFGNSSREYVILHENSAP